MFHIMANMQKSSDMSFLEKGGYSFYLITVLGWNKDIFTFSNIPHTGMLQGLY